MLRPGGRVVTAVWATPDRNPWFAEPRAAVAEALGPSGRRSRAISGGWDRSPSSSACIREAGFDPVAVRVVSGTVPFESAAAHWATCVGQIGHFTRLDAVLTADERERVLAALAPRLRPPVTRTQLLAVATR